jgi:RNA polymerase sigma-32 factor
MENANWQENAHEALSEALSKLDERSRYIVQRRWLDADKGTLQELAAYFGISAERVRQLETQAIARIKELMLNAE